MKLHKMWMLISIGSIVAILADQLTKYLAQTNFTEQPLVLISDFLVLRSSFNPGIAFSIPVPNALMILITPLVIAIICSIVIKDFDIQKRHTKIILALLLAGGFSNLIDRIIHGGVTDFIAFSFWPSFNLADSYLVIAGFLLVWNYGRIER